MAIAHQVPMGAMHSNPEHVKLFEQWMKGYKPEELFDENGTLIPDLKEVSTCRQQAHEC